MTFHFLRGHVSRGQIRLFCVWLLPLLLVCGSAATAQDARAILQKTMQSYQALSSYSGRAAVTSQIIYKNQVVKDDSFTVSFKFRRPNRLLLDMGTPSGSRQVFSDSSHFSIFAVSENTFMRFPSAPDMRQTLNLLVSRAGVFAFLDPLYFACENHLPTELGDLKFKANADWNGHSVSIITGVTRIKEQILTDRQGRKLRIPAETRQWTWWIDRQSALIWKIESRAENVPFSVLKKQGKKMVPSTVPTTSFTRHVVAEAQSNPALKDGEFQFVIPSGAREKRPDENGKSSGRR